MPKYSYAKGSLSFLSWLFLIIAVTSFLYAVWQTPYLLLIVPLIIIAVYFENKKRNNKLLALAEERKNEDICNFSRSFDCRKIDTWVIRAVYEEIQEYMPSKTASFPINANDNLFKTLDIDDEDLEMDLIDRVAQRTKRSLNNTENNLYYGKVITVKDLVCFINEQPLLKNT